MGSVAQATVAEMQAPVQLFSWRKLEELEVISYAMHHGMMRRIYPTAFGQPRHRARAWGLVAIDFVFRLGRPFGRTVKTHDGILFFFVFGRLVTVNVFSCSASHVAAGWSKQPPSKIS